MNTNTILEELVSVLDGAEDYITPSQVVRADTDDLERYIRDIADLALAAGDTMTADVEERAQEVTRRLQRKLEALYGYLGMR